MILFYMALGFLAFLGSLVVLEALPFKWSKSIVNWFAKGK